MVADVPPVPAPTTTHVGTGCRSWASWLEDRLGDVVVAAPVGGPLGVGELVEVVPAGLVGEPPRLVVDRAPGRRRGGSGRPGTRSASIFSGDVDRRHHRDERQAEQPGEVRLGHRGRARGRLDDRGALADPAVAQRVEEQRPGQPVLQRAGRVDRLVLEVEVDVPVRPAAGRRAGGCRPSGCASASTLRIASLHPGPVASAVGGGPPTVQQPSSRDSRRAGPRVTPRPGSSASLLGAALLEPPGAGGPRRGASTRAAKRSRVAALSRKYDATAGHHEREHDRPEQRHARRRDDHRPDADDDRERSRRTARAAARCRRRTPSRAQLRSRPCWGLP